MTTPKVSICMSTFNKPDLLKLTLKSIRRQKPPFPYEIVVVDDGGERAADIKRWIDKYDVDQFFRIERRPVFRNPCTARNVAYKMARGDIIIAQSDEVIHWRNDTIETLADDLRPGIFVIANVFNVEQDGRVSSEFTGPKRQKPFFFLGSLYREDLFAVGGNDEDFAAGTGYEDDWFAMCLIHGRGLTPYFTTRVVGHHQWHPNINTSLTDGPAKALWEEKIRRAKAGEIPWQSSGGPWQFSPSGYIDLTNTESIFTSIWQKNSWGNNESCSGNGSSVAVTRKVREGLQAVISKHGIKTMLDIPCGDFNWMKEMNLDGIDYIGGDIVLKLIQGNQRHVKDNVSFRHMDLIKTELPKVDLVFCRDCLGHLSQEDAMVALKNIVRSRSRFLMVTTFTGKSYNRKISTGEWTPYNLCLEPFNFPNPLQLVNEDCQECYPDFNDKCLGLWRVTDLELTRSIVVCVDCGDFLNITLPRNKQLFSETLIVTAPHDRETIQIARDNGCQVHTTNAFYRNGAKFNKGAAMEEGFDVLGRSGWICVWDADIVMPESIRIEDKEFGHLYSARRRILPDPTEFRNGLDWSRLQSPTEPHEFSGYFQLFHASSVLSPWYTSDWTHAGGGDNDFSDKFPPDEKHHVPFDVLHLGPEGDNPKRIGMNWMGRVTDRIDRRDSPKVRDDSPIQEMIQKRIMHGTKFEKIEPPTGIPQRMSFFWHGSMSWLRWMTLKSFMRFNPDWDVRLYVSTEPLGKKAWKTHEDSDDNHNEHDHMERVEELGVNIYPWTPPRKGLAPAQACDLFQWDVLSKVGGFYADMDILWLNPLEPTRVELGDADVVFCLESGYMAVGFFASLKGHKLFSDLFQSAVKFNDLTNYQLFGTSLVYELSKLGPEHITENPGIKAVALLSDLYPDAAIRVAPDETVYPFDWKRIDQIFKERWPLPDSSAGLHWFGGHPLAQRWNNRLTADNWMKEQVNTLTSCLKKIL